MGDQSDKHGWIQKQPMGFLTGLLNIRGFISRLISLVSVTQQDLRNAGIYHSYRRD